jgi:hypothetical protein
MPFCSQLKKEVVECSHAVATSPWTVPSHGSIFTGKFPWNHGAHALAGNVLSEGVPTLAERLGRLGYRSLSLSGNGLLSPLLGLARGHDTVLWADWWEHLVRGLPLSAPNIVGPWPGLAQHATVEKSSILPQRATGLISHLFLRYPEWGWYINALAAKLQGTSHGSVHPSPWIEASLRVWLESVPSHEPVAVFVNLFDLHEPYFGRFCGPSDKPPLRPRLRVRQEGSNYIMGDYELSSIQKSELKGRYEISLCELDTRIRTIVEMFRSIGRWDRTLFFLTSDHGQSLAEDGFLFHGITTQDSVIRIPFWFRLPGTDHLPKRLTSVVSLVDILPTVARGLGAQFGGESDGVALQDLTHAPRPAPAMVLADGIMWKSTNRNWFDSRLLDRFDRPKIVAIEDRCQVVYDVQSGKHEWIIAPELRGQMQDGVVRRKLEASIAVAHQRLASRTLRETTAVVERLQSWGYA